MRNCYFLGTLGAWKPMWISWFFIILWISQSCSSSLLDKTSLLLNVDFYSSFEHISGSTICKNTLCSDYHNVWGYWRKKDHKNISLTFVIASLQFLHCYEHLWSKTFVKTHLQGVKVENNGVPVVKISFSL